MNLEKIVLVPVWDVLQIPRELFEMDEGLHYTYETVVANFVPQRDRGTVLAIMDLDKPDPVGVLWLSFLAPSRTIFVNYVALEKEYRGFGILHKKIKPFLQELCRIMRFERALFTTQKPNYYVRHGCKKLPHAVVELT